MVKYAIFAACLATSLPFATKATAAPKEKEVDFVRVIVRYADKVSEFRAQKTKAGADLKFSSSDGKKREKKITAEDFKFIADEATALKGQSNDMKFCPRLHIAIEASGHKPVIGCLGSPSAAAKRALTLANVLSLAR